MTKPKAHKLPKGTPAPPLPPPPAPVTATFFQSATPPPSTFTKPLSRESVRQVEETALRKLRMHMRVHNITLSDLLDIN